LRDPLRWALSSGICGLLQRAGRRPARLQAEQSFSARTCRAEKQMECDFAAAAAKLCEFCCSAYAQGLGG